MPTITDPTIMIKDMTTNTIHTINLILLLLKIKTKAIAGEATDLGIKTMARMIDMKEMTGMTGMISMISMIADMIVDMIVEVIDMMIGKANMIIETKVGMRIGIMGSKGSMEIGTEKEITMTKTGETMRTKTEIGIRNQSLIPMIIDQHLYHCKSNIRIIVLYYQSLILFF